jgi:polysaccharide deacetylase family protein (PEP-CTERM system associated)
MPHTTETYDGTFTVDVEDYFQVSAFESVISREDWGRYESRVEASTSRILEIAEAAGTRGTFFILGWVAQQLPGLIRRIQAAGHEIGCHSQWHRLVYELGPGKFRQDLRESRDTLEQITGEPVRLYRSPSFSITERSLWALEILLEEGFDTDSSIYPVRHDRYGIPDAPVSPHRIQTPSGQIREFPGLVSHVGGLRVPAGGGGYLRLFPWMLTQHLLKSIRREGRPLNIYIHPWEVDPDQPRISAGWKSRFRHYQNLKSTSGKLQNLLTEFRLTTMSDVLSSMDLPLISPTAPPQTESANGTAALHV